MSEEETTWVLRKSYGRKRNAKSVTIFMREQGDRDRVERLHVFLGCSRSEVVRTAIRTYAGQVMGIHGVPGRRPKN